MQCVAVWECVSFNFRTTGGLENNCQLNDETKDSSLPTEYGENSGFVYYEASREVSRSCGDMICMSSYKEQNTNLIAKFCYRKIPAR